MIYIHKYSMGKDILKWSGLDKTAVFLKGGKCHIFFHPGYSSFSSSEMFGWVRYEPIRSSMFFYCLFYLEILALIKPQNVLNLQGVKKAIVRIMITIKLNGLFIQFLLRNSNALYQRRKMSSQTMLETLIQLRYSKSFSSSCFRTEFSQNFQSTQQTL